MGQRPSADFQSPQVLMAVAKAEMSVVPNERLFNDRAHEKSREKWCAAMLGLGYEKCVAPCRVAVNDSNQRADVDLYLETESREYPFQLVEVMEPKRLRGAEYKALAKGELKGFRYEPERGRIEGPQWIADGIAKKVGKNYAGARDLNLLVYANFSGHLLQHADVVAAARPHLQAFASVWVVTSTWLGALSVSNSLRPINGWYVIFTPEDYAADQAG